MEISKKIRNHILIFVGMIIVFSIAMILAYSIPNDMIYENLKDSKEYIEGNRNNLYGKEVLGTIQDLYSDYLILNTSLNLGKSDDENILERAFLNSRYSNIVSDRINGNSYQSLLTVIDYPETHNNQEYYRYWHGIQTIVRPIMSIFTYEEAKFFLMIVMFLMFVLSAIKINELLGIKTALAYASSLLITCFISVPMTFQLTGIYSVMMIGIMLLLHLFKKQKEQYISYLFLIIGGLSAFMDLMTVPIITLGSMLVIFTLYKFRYDTNFKMRSIITKIIKLGLIWLLAYILTFASKWCIAEIVSEENVFHNVFENILYRTVGDEDAIYVITPSKAISKNVGILFNDVIKVLSVMFIVTWIIVVIKNKGFDKKSLKLIIPLSIIALLPYIVYSILVEHSVGHFQYSYRIQVITLFSVIVLGTELPKKVLTK